MPQPRHIFTAPVAWLIVWLRPQDGVNDVDLECTVVARRTGQLLLPRLTWKSPDRDVPQPIVLHDNDEFVWVTPNAG